MPLNELHLIQELGCMYSSLERMRRMLEVLYGNIFDYYGMGLPMMVNFSKENPGKKSLHTTSLHFKAVIIPLLVVVLH